MTHGLEKSDSAVVAVKPANKAAPAVAEWVEWVEPGAGTKGNAEQTPTRRTQSRERGSQGLDGVRHACLHACSPTLATRGKSRMRELRTSG